MRDILAGFLSIVILYAFAAHWVARRLGFFMNLRDDDGFFPPVVVIVLAAAILPIGLLMVAAYEGDEEFFKTKARIEAEARRRAEEEKLLANEGLL